MAQRESERRVPSKFTKMGSSLRDRTFRTRGGGLPAGGVPAPPTPEEEEIMLQIETVIDRDRDDMEIERYRQRCRWR